MRSDLPIVLARDIVSFSWNLPKQGLFLQASKLKLLLAALNAHNLSSIDTIATPFNCPDLLDAHMWQTGQRARMSL